MNESKAELRTRLKHERLTLNDADHTLKSRAIVAKLKQITDWSSIKTLHYFEPINELLEPDISDLITYLEDTYADLKLFTPRLINNKWELVAARGGELSPDYEVVIVPALGFDDNLQRIGYGGGYYDKFLDTQPNSLKIGVCFELGHLKKMPVETHDIGLDIIVTEEAIYRR
jgi:5-formyltetrahydrofolate cyclo-ligase